MSTLTGKVERVERLGTSYWGNPYYRVGILDDSGETHIVRTRIDAGINYAINNPEYRDLAHTFVLTRAGRILWAYQTRCDVCHGHDGHHARYCPGAVTS